MADSDKKTFIGKLVDESYDDKENENLTEKDLARKKKRFSSFNKGKDKLGDTQEIPIVDGEDKAKIKRHRQNSKYIIIGLLVILAIFILYNLSKKSYKIDNLYEEYARAIDDRNADYLNSIVDVEGMKVSIEDFNTTFKLLDEDFEFEKEIKSYVAEDIKKIKENPDYISDRNIRVVRAKNRWLFLPGYKVVWTPITITNQNTGELDITSANEKISLASKDKDKLIFGLYDSLYKDRGLNIKGTIEIKDLKNKDYNYYFNGNGEIVNEKIDLKRGEKSIKINTNEPEAIVFVNNKNTGLTVDEFNKIGSFDMDEKAEIFLLARPQWGYVTSNRQSLEDKSSLDLNINYRNGNIEREVISLLKKVFKEDEKALASNDPSKYESLTGEAYYREEANLSLNEGYGRRVSRKYTSFKVDKNFKSDKDTNGQLKVDVFVNFGEKKYGADEEEPSVDSLQKAENVPYSFTIKYDYNKKEYYITNWEKTYSQISESMIEVKMN